MTDYQDKIETSVDVNMGTTFRKTPPERTPVYVISGLITGDVQEGVTVDLGGDASDSTTTDSEGRYLFYVSSGQYTVTPTLFPYGFTPAAQNVTVSAANVYNVDFVAAGLPERWQRCSDNAIVAYTSVGFVPDDFAWLCNGGIYTKSYLATRAAGTITAPDYLTQCDSTPIDCSELTGWPASDFSGGVNVCDSQAIGDTNYNVRWNAVPVTALPTESITNGYYTAFLQLRSLGERGCLCKMNIAPTTSDLCLKADLSVQNLSHTGSEITGPTISIRLYTDDVTSNRVEIGWGQGATGEGYGYFIGTNFITTTVLYDNFLDTPFELRKVGTTYTGYINGIQVFSTTKSATVTEAWMFMTNGGGGTGTPVSCDVIVKNLELNDNINGDGTGNVIDIDPEGFACPL